MTIQQKRRVSDLKQRLCRVTGGFILVASLLSPVTAQASPSGYAASDVLGQPGFTTLTSGSGTDGLSYPTGTALDTNHHRLFVADESNNRVLEYDLDSHNNLIDHTADHVLGQANFSASGNLTTSQSTFDSPYAALVYDNLHDRLFVSDSGNNRVMIFDLSNGITDGMPAIHELGQPDFNTTGNNDDQSKLGYTEGLAYDPGHQWLFVSDYSNKRIMVFNVSPGTLTDGMPAIHELGQPDFQTYNGATLGPDSFDDPEAIAYNPTTQQLFVGDSRHFRIMVFDFTNGITDGMSATYVLGQPDLNTENQNGATQHDIGQYQEGMGIDTTRNILYAADDSLNRILIFDLSGGITDNMNASMVLGQVDFTSNDYSCNTAADNLCDIEGNITVDETNNRIYVPDSDNDRVLVFNFPALSGTAGVAAGTVGATYSSILGTSTTTASNYTVTSGSLPPGLALDANTGALTGTPTQAGSFTFTIHLNNDFGAIGSFPGSASRSYTINIATTAATVTTAAATPLLLTNTGINITATTLLAAVLIVSSIVVYRRRATATHSGK